MYAADLSYTPAFVRTQVHRLTTSVGQCQGFIQVQDRQAESSPQAEVGNRRADGQIGRSGRRRVESRGGRPEDQESGTEEQTGRRAGRQAGWSDRQGSENWQDCWKTGFKSPEISGYQETIWQEIIVKRGLI